MGDKLRLVDSHLVAQWFDDVLLKHLLPRPSAEARLLIAEQMNQAIWREEDAGLPHEHQRNASVSMLHSDRFQKVFDDENQLLASLEDLKLYWPDRRFDREKDGFPFDQLETALADLGVSGHVSDAARIRRAVNPKDRGRPPGGGWVGFAKPWAKMVRLALVELGATQQQADPTNVNGFTAAIGALMVAHVADQEITPESFAKQMAGPRPTRAKNPKPMFPHTGRLKTA